eukprot:Nitzschia sp. Nitz4//scaffold10_size219509//115070//124411//NITZ4_001433-RA/size219509-processed-gene-0.134-mRNA-1//-1//CDS//3329532935//5914//frame0
MQYSSRSPSPSVHERKSPATSPLATPPTSGSAPPTSAVNPQSMDRVSTENSGLQNLGSGFHMPAQVLGQVESQEISVSEKEKEPPLSNLNLRARKRSQLAVRRSHSQAATAVAAQWASVATEPLDSTMFTFVTYQGVELLFGMTAHHTLLGVCSRTHLIFQSLTLASESPVVALTSNSESGWIIVAHQDGTIQTYRPVRTNPSDSTKDSSAQTPVFGKYRWVDCLTIETAEFFAKQGEPVSFADRRAAKPEQLVDISTALDRLSVAHKNQLAIFDLTPEDGPVTPRTAGSTGRLLWTTLLHSDIRSAKLAGDGQAVVVVLSQPEPDGKVGCKTFVHDLDDGSGTGRPRLVRGTSVGVLYKEGPFLVHNSPVSRISFRGLGRVTSSPSSVDEQGNDLLLTYCEGDSTVRIFNQNSWDQLMIWVAPPDSRADWIRGSSSFSLGDLEPQRKSKGGSKAHSRRPSGASSAELSAAGAINAGLGSRNLGAGAPTTAAGAWISEITFRGAFPALRLSRLSYMKRGNDDSQPAHFESVAAILPVGSIVSNSVLRSDDMGLFVQGIWPAWNPWLSPPSGDHSSDTLQGSAMQFLGLSSVPPTHAQHFGDSYLGGTHSPPTELRIAASHPTTGNIVLLEFPLWGDDDFGAMELGSPIRSVLALSSAYGPSTKNETRSVSIPYDSTRLSAQIGPEKRSISLLWKKPASQSIYSDEYEIDAPLVPQSFYEVTEPASPHQLQDMSIMPVPLALPSLQLPETATGEEIVVVQWWPDDSFDGPPILLALTRSSKLIIFEIPPPRSVREPAMPTFDPFTAEEEGARTAPEDSGDEDTVLTRQEYEVQVTPHPDFGLGLRLESPMDGLPAIAGSFKKHPLNGGMLPAEKTGMIILGDEVLSVNGVSLENMTFDDIIATVRHVGAEAGPGQPLALRFRPASSDRSRRNSAVLAESFSVRQIESVPSGESEQSTGRRAVIGVTLKDGSQHAPKQAAGGNLVTMLSWKAETQQAFGRVLAILRQAIPFAGDPQISDRFVVKPWGKGVGAPSPSKLRGAALLVTGQGNNVYFKRLELPLDSDSKKPTLVDMGHAEIQHSDSSKVVSIQSIEAIRSPSLDGTCFSVADESGTVFLLFAEFKESDDAAKPLNVSFRTYPIFDLDLDASRFQIRAESMLLFATYEKGQDCQVGCTIRLWSARADPTCRKLETEQSLEDKMFGLDYIETKIDVLPSDNSSAEVIDFVFLTTGYLDGSSTLVVFLKAEVIVYQRRGQSLRWVPILRCLCSWIPTSSPRNVNLLRVPTVDPLDTFSHLLSSIRWALPSFDENKYMLSDWHPENLLAHLCTDSRGAKVALHKNVHAAISWLADHLESDTVGTEAAPLLVVPFSAAGGNSLLDLTTTVDEKGAKESAANLFSSAGTARGEVSAKEKELSKIRRLLEVLSQPENFAPRRDSGKSTEFKLAMAHLTTNTQDTQSSFIDLPAVLRKLSPAEIRVLWVMTNLTLNKPKYEKLDAQGQLALTLFTTHTCFASSPSDSSQKDSMKATSPFSGSGMTSFFARKKSSDLHEKSKLPPQCASAGCVSALISNYQSLLVDSLRKPGGKYDWSTVRELRMVFWIRSDDNLRQISEEVGQALYRESRDILKAAIFFLAAGKKRTLTNLSAADRTDSGKKFFKFLTGFDFTSERGRSAAEKNAYSLLRKNKYDSAAAFFLLADPPLLKSAVETIASKMEDLDLAFLVARLVGNTKTDAMALGGGGLGMGFGGVLGGGGGYADAGAATTPEIKQDAESFASWKPQLCQGAKDLLLDRVLPESYEDPKFSAIAMMWLGRKNDAWHWLSGFVECQGGIVPTFVSDVKIRRLNELTASAKRSRDSTLSMTNEYINFIAGPVLLKMTNASLRTLIASSILVATSLSKVGLELPALRVLVHNTENFVEDADEKPATAPPKQVSSSIFDGFDGPPVSNAQASSSIFDSFDAAPPMPAKPSGPVSSIFDSFDAPPPPRANPTPAAPVSSIFDDFDGPPKPSVPKAAPVSSIFDSFDPAPPVKQTNAVSSIFDDFEPAPIVKKPAAPPVEPASSIFDSFDPAPVVKKPPVASSIFDEYDAAPISRQNVSATTTSRVAVHETQDSTSPGPPSSTTPMRKPALVWQEWRDHLVLQIAARRLIRETGTLGAHFYVDNCVPAMSPSMERNSMTIPSGAALVLQTHAEGIAMLSELKQILADISKSCSVDENLLVDEALNLLNTPYLYVRTCIAILLLVATGRIDSAEDVVRHTSQLLLEKSCFLSFSNDSLTSSKKAAPHSSTLQLRQLALHYSWQLELCLWLHRGSALPLSGLVLNEAVCAIRVGFIAGGWNRDFDTLQNLIRQPPDCRTDEKLGRQLWTSLKLISNSVPLEKRASAVGSGGWEFLVDCRRAEATELLRHRSTGCFIIRPHPDDHGVFTLSFKTNLVPTQEVGSKDTTEAEEKQQGKPARAIKPDDVVQHAIIRLSDSGFRCGSFGPFATLMKLLEAVSSSLPFNLRFDKPPTEGIIKEEGSKPSPNAAFIHKLYFSEGNKARSPVSPIESAISEDGGEDDERKERFGFYLELLVISELRKQLCSVAAAKYDNSFWVESNDAESVGSDSATEEEWGPEQEYAVAARVLRPFLTWCRLLEVGIVGAVAPHIKDVVPDASSLPLALNELEDAIEVSTTVTSGGAYGGDAVVRRMIQPGSGVQFRTLRLGDAAESAMVVLFSKNEAIDWFLKNGVEKTEESAVRRLEMMEKSRVIEPVDFQSLLPLASKHSKVENGATDNGTDSGVVSKGVRYRLVDPWEVEPLQSRAAETKGARLGRHIYLSFGMGRVASSCEGVFRSLGGTRLLDLWAAGGGGVSLTKAVATVHPPWERGSGGDLQLQDGVVCEPLSFDNSIRQHLYRNALFRRLGLPQRFLALIQVELLDLKNLTSPGGSVSLTVYSLLRLKRPRSNAPLTTKARTLDSVATQPTKLGKSTGPNAPASWGSLVRFRFPLPEFTATDGRSYDGDREALFKGPPTVLQVAVYEKKFMTDTLLGCADVKLDGLCSGGQLEEWVPLRTDSHGINWFARIRLTLRFELMCLSDDNSEGEELAPSVGLRRIKELGTMGGLHEDVRKSASTPDLLSYLESMVY